MATLLEMAKEIVVSHAQTTPLSTDELLAELQKVYAALQALESGAPIDAGPAAAAEESTAPALTLKQAFKKDEVICLICGKGKMQTLARHLNQAHQMKPHQYRKEFNIPKTTPLMAKSYAARRKEIAAGMDLTANLEKARAARKSSAARGKTKKK